MASLDAFLSLDLRIGTIVSAELLKGARKPAFALRIDFGELGVRAGSAEVTDLYDAEDLVGLQVTAVVNMPPQQVAGVLCDAMVEAAIQPKEIDYINAHGSASLFNDTAETMAIKKTFGEHAYRLAGNLGPSQRFERRAADFVRHFVSGQLPFCFSHT